MYSTALYSGCKSSDRFSLSLFIRNARIRNYDRWWPFLIKMITSIAWRLRFSPINNTPAEKKIIQKKYKLLTIYFDLIIVYARIFN